MPLINLPDDAINRMMLADHEWNCGHLSAEEQIAIWERDKHSLRSKHEAIYRALLNASQPVASVELTKQEIQTLMQGERRQQNTGNPTGEERRAANHT